MMVYKCDSCKKELNDDEEKDAVNIHPHMSSRWKLLLCEKCGQDIIELLKNKKFIE